MHWKLFSETRISSAVLYVEQEDYLCCVTGLTIMRSGSLRTGILNSTEHAVNSSDALGQWLLGLEISRQGV